MTDLGELCRLAHSVGLRAQPKVVVGDCEKSLALYDQDRVLVDLVRGYQNARIWLIGYKACYERQQAQEVK